MQISQFFQRKTRDSGETFYTTTDDRLEWLHDAIHACHQSDLPNDWIYETCYAVACAIDDGSLATGDDESDAVHQFADNQVDAYTRNLMQWVADMCLTDVYASSEARASDFGEPSSDMTKQAGVIQYCAIEQIAETMLAAFRKGQDCDACEGDVDCDGTGNAPESEAP